MSEIIEIGVLTISDRCYENLARDASGDALEMRINENEALGERIVVKKRLCVPDEVLVISNILREWSDIDKLDVILTTGGTGFTARDVTPEATKNVIQKETFGITMAILSQSLQKTPMAMLSRLTSGIRQNTLIVNFPGSPKACYECLPVIRPVLRHAVDLIKNKEAADKMHRIILQDAKSCATAIGSKVSKVNIDAVARRNRVSPFPMIPVDIAQQVVIEMATKLFDPKPTNLKIMDALNYVCSCDILAREDFPPFPASMKDGYAVIASDGDGPREVIAYSIAGNETTDFLFRKGECVRITTGAPLPKSADAVVQVENTDLVAEDDNGKVEKSIIIKKPVHVGQDVRTVGSDIGAGELLVKSGTCLTSFELGLLATAGVLEIPVFRKPSIGVLSTGNELRPHDTPLSYGKIRDSNKVTLLMLLKENGFEAIDCGIALDEPTILLNEIRRALQRTDVLITTGGVSMGERDLLTDVLREDLDASLLFGRLNMKPGKPTKVFTVNFENKPKLIFALPGNPVSAIVTCHLFVLPALKAITGIANPYPKLIKTKIDSDIKLDWRFEYARASLIWTDEDDTPWARLTGNQVSSRLLSFTTADCLLHLPAATESLKMLKRGHVVKGQLIRNL